ncbi:tRNA/rRNA methyltransferase [Trypanosoma melophagium]|uniref:tRNA/rRNA methyltransferase n=1 Tax=Trypanosoma melophagium TaxID=715481 RepID=UPI00351A03DF|nr:tRNA/rRNA methyltransferase [Trypanosoma melophagium]
MLLARVLRRCRSVHPNSLRKAPLALQEMYCGRKDTKGKPIVLQTLDESAQISPNISLTGRQMWNSTKLIRENRSFRQIHGACVVGGSDNIKCIWRKYKILPNVVYVPDTEPSVPSWCLEEELPTCIVRCSPVEINRKLLSAEFADGYAAEFPIPPFPTLENYLGENKFTRLSSMLVLIGLRIPSNVGLLIRAAVDMGFESVLLEDCVDLYNEKVLRASGGAVFSPKIKLFETHSASVSVLSNIAMDHKLLPLLAVPSQNAESAFTVAKRLHSLNAEEKRHEEGDGIKEHCGPMIILGSESQGLKNLVGEWDVPHHFVSIPLSNHSVGSVNVGVAGSVLLHAFRPAAEAHFAELSLKDRECLEGAKREGMATRLLPH